MKSVKILGTGCPKCKRTTELVEQVVEELSLANVSVEKVEDILKIMEYNVMSTPAVVVDEQVVIKGRVPSRGEIVDLLMA